MNIAFSTEWFLTIPGILITCGVILLIIALIMFIVGSTKGKKNKEMPKVEAPVGAVQPQVQVQPVDNVQPVVQPESQENSFINNDAVAVSEPMGPIEEVTPVAPVIPEVPVVDVPQVAPVVTEVETPVDSVSAVEIPTVVVPTPEASPVAEVTPIPEVPVINTEAIPTVNEPVVEVPEVNNLEATNVNIYGGVVPTVEVSPVQPVEEARPIYGGADPLEATQNLPKMDVHHEPYSGGSQPVAEVAPVVPTPVEVTPIPEVEPVVNEQPAVAPTPSVVEIPDVEQL